MQNAALHGGAEGLIALDVRDFYPSISETQVKQVFKQLCRFPDDVAEVLTRLTTLDGSVPQGACTSSNLANLVFFEHEHIVVKQLMSQGFLYTRLLDDISISSKSRPFSDRQKNKIVEQIASLLKMYGMHLKNKKTKVTSKSNPEHLMEVTGLWLNRGKPRVKRSERLVIRKEVRKTVQLFGISRSDPEYHKTFNRASGRVAMLAHLGHAEASVARMQLRDKLPHLNIEAQLHLSRQVRALKAAKPGKRATIEYIERYFKAKYQVKVLMRSNRSRALDLEKKLLLCAPTRSREDIIYG